VFTKKKFNTGNGIIADLTGLIHDQDVDSCNANNTLNLIINFDFFKVLETTYSLLQKTGNENFPNVNVVLSICQLIVYLTIPIKYVELKSKRNMTGRSLGCALSNLPLTGAYHTVVSLGAKT
jgi:hypothetical protein